MEIQNLDRQPQLKSAPRRKILKSTKKHELILRAALECFSNQGLAKTNLADIAKASGISSSHILYHFKNNDEIFESLILAMFKEAQNRSKEYSKKASTKTEKLEAYVHAMFDWLFSNKNYQRLLLQFYSESFYNSNLKALRQKIHQSALDYFELLLADKNKARAAQNLLTGALIEFSADHIHDVKIRNTALEFIKKLL